MSLTGGFWCSGTRRNPAGDGNISLAALSLAPPGAVALGERYGAGAGATQTPSDVSCHVSSGTTASSAPPQLFFSS